MFTDALDYLKQYREQRRQALTNKIPMPWFTTPADDLDQLITVGTFGSLGENSEWENLNQQSKIDSAKMQAVRIKIAFLAGCRHDLRGQFTVTANNDPKTACDFDRQAVSDLAGANYMTENLRLVVAAKSQGAS